MPTENTDIDKVSVRLARNPREIEAAQQLRYKVFYEEYAATPSPEMLAQGRDFDPFDEVADHLVVLDAEGTKNERIVGTYRLLSRKAAAKRGQFYSSGEYDISQILGSKSEVLELGRSCVLPEYRTRPVLQLLWDGISQYVVQHNIDLLFGCGSLHGTDTSKLEESLSYLYHFHLAPAPIRARALEGRYIDMNIIAKEDIDPKAALNNLPPLMKGYLRIGAMIGDGAVIDHQFNTTDVFVVMPTEFVAHRYRQHYERKNQKPLPVRQTEEADIDIAAFARGNA